MAAKLYIRKVKEKMDTLKSDRLVLQEVLNDYVDAVHTEADKWVTRNECPGRSYRDICGILDECSNFLTEKSGEIAVALGREDEEENKGEATASSTTDKTAAASPSPAPPSSSLSSLPPSLAPGATRSSPREDYHFLKMKERIDNLENHRGNQEKEISDIKSDVTTVSSKVDILEKRPLPVGFTARLPAGQVPTFRINAVIANFTQVINNTGGHFNVSSGEFVAPNDGLYVTHISVTSGGSVVHLRVYCLRSSGTEEEVCDAYNAHGYQITASGMGLVRMSKNDKVYVKEVEWNGSQVKYPSSFSCYMIG